MGDEVKITVIATGFKQDMPERRARMLSESLSPVADYQVPIRSRGRGPEAPAMFASEERELRQAGQLPEASKPEPVMELTAEDEPEVETESDELEVGLNEAEEVVAEAEVESAPELVPVPASVFDDDFFRSAPKEPVMAAPRQEISMAEPRGFAGTALAGPAIMAVPQADVDELDIPAFLRKGH
jgi:cell division protein FtsZ